MFDATYRSLARLCLISMCIIIIIIIIIINWLSFYYRSLHGYQQLRVFVMQ